MSVAGRRRGFGFYTNLQLSPAIKHLFEQKLNSNITDTFKENQ